MKFIEIVAVIIMLSANVVYAKENNKDSAEYTPEKMELLRTDCVTNDHAANCAKLGAILEQQNKKTEAKEFYRRGCLALIKPIGDSCYLWGLLAKKDETKLQAFQMACKLNDADGCTDVGEIYMRQKKQAEALVYYIKGCKGGDGRGCHRVAVRMLKQDKLQDIAKYLERSCNLQYPPGCGLLGWYLEKHAKQLERAIQMYRLACKSKVAAACKRLEQLLNQKKQPEKTAPKKTIKK